jgi:peptidoglycan/LPS O-acetylase OafA/YrhL
VSKSKFLYLESLRGIAAITVAIFHAPVFSNTYILGRNPFVANATLMVDFFFVLSGFVIAYNYIDRITDFASLAGFQIKRFLRLYPLHLLTLLVFSGIEIAKYFFELKTGIAPGTPAFAESDLAAFVNNFFLTQAIFEDTFTFNQPSWSISTEFYTYAMFGMLILLISSSWGRVVGSLVIVVFSGLIIHVYNADHATNGLIMFRCTYAFFLGVLVHRLYSDTQFRLQSWVVYLAVTMAIVAVWFGRGITGLIHPFVFAFLILSLLWSGESRLKSILHSRKLIFLGTVSYGIYMIHAAVWWVTMQTFRFIFGFQTVINTKTGTREFLFDDVTATGLLIGGLCIVVYLAFLSYKFVEMPFNRLRK